MSTMSGFPGKRMSAPGLAVARAQSLALERGKRKMGEVDKAKSHYSAKAIDEYVESNHVVLQEVRDAILNLHKRVEALENKQPESSLFSGSELFTKDAKRG